jgi:hypothetical protein
MKKREAINNNRLQFLINWTYDADMFKSTPEGKEFGEELREIFYFAMEYLAVKKEIEK